MELLGFRITEAGFKLLNAYIKGSEILYIPGVDYKRLRDMALVLNKFNLCSREGYFILEPEEAKNEDLMAISSLLTEGYIERDILPVAGEIAEREDFFQRFRNRRPF